MVGTDDLLSDIRRALEPGLDTQARDVTQRDSCVLETSFTSVLCSRASHMRERHCGPNLIIQ